MIKTKYMFSKAKDWAPKAKDMTSCPLAPRGQGHASRTPSLCSTWSLFKLGLFTGSDDVCLSVCMYLSVYVCVLVSVSVDVSVVCS